MKKNIMDIFDISDRIAIVTGGSKGIGEGIAMDLARAGAHVVVVSRHLAEGEKVAQQIRALGRNSMAIAADVSKCQDIISMVDKVYQQFRRIDILVNSAGTIVRKPAVELLEEEWDRIFDTNLKGAFFAPRLWEKS
jgi:NAD(P)-dependent dehydrogenase (short-subunit alcohol dehydrogenase family)